MFEKLWHVLNAVYFSECTYEHQEYVECIPCRKLNCNDGEPRFCLSLMNICLGSGCYCKPGFLWEDLLSRCLDPEECGNHLSEYDYYDDEDYDKEE